MFEIQKMTPSLESSSTVVRSRTREREQVQEEVEEKHKSKTQQRQETETKVNHKEEMTYGSIDVPCGACGERTWHIRGYERAGNSTIALLQCKNGRRASIQIEQFHEGPRCTISTGGMDYGPLLITCGQCQAVNKFKESVIAPIPTVGGTSFNTECICGAAYRVTLYNERSSC